MSESGKQRPSENTLREGADPFHLDLPDAHGFVSRRSVMPLDKFLGWLEEMRAMFPLSEWQRERRRQDRCDQEFIL